MQNKWVWISMVVLVAIAVAISAAVFMRVPEQIVSHWNAQGQPDDTMGRFWGLALIPVMMLGLTCFMMIVPVLDPLRENIEKFRSIYNLFILVTNLYLLYIHVLTVLWNLGVRYDFNLSFIPAIAVFFYLIGVLLGRTKRNWFIGIRTPWTMSSDVVWNKTHMRGALLFKIAAGLMLPGVLFPDLFLVLLFVPLLTFVLYLVVFSYIIYRREKQTSL